jgi:cell division protease FtsH
VVWLVLATGLMGLWLGLREGPGTELSYTEFKAKVAEGGVERVVIGETAIEGELQGPEDAEEPERFTTVRVEDPELVGELERAGVEIEGEPPTHGLAMLAFVLPWILVPLLLGFLVWRGVSRMGKAGLGFAKSPAKLLRQTPTGVDFDDVAGCDEAKAELQEVVDFLEDRSRYEALGARIPKGVLLVGPPGTGKTLLARAVAGEAKVPFYSLSGSDFVEMFVGVGAARVRDLFEQASRHAPCIVFIDELDAIGRRRGIHLGVVNDEREQTLNQLLVELDGFEPNSGVILLAATNRPDVLDPALLRPGRFDRQVVLDAPDLSGRLAILKVHVRGKAVKEGVDLERVARATPGFSGADLSNTVNEAALGAVRRGATTIEQCDLDEAVEKVIAGPERRSRRLGPTEKRRVAVHEVGHALVAHFGGGPDPVQKISIVPRGRAALGYTLQIPDEDRFLATRTELLQRIEGLMAGRAAEELCLGEVSTGSEDDIAKATLLARRMVALLGMGERTGLARCAHTGDELTLAHELQVGQRDCSDATAKAIDDEVERLLQEAHAAARHRLETHRAALDRVVKVLLEREVLDREAFLRLVSDPLRATA